MYTIGERVRSLRELYGMTGQEVADLGGIKNASQVSKVESGHNLATTLHMRVGLAKGFGLSLDEFNSFLDERMDAHHAHRLGFPRIAAKLNELRERVAMAHQEELEEAIRKVQVDPGVVVLARRIASNGKQQTVDRWIHTLHYLQGIFEKMTTGKPILGD